MIILNSLILFPIVWFQQKVRYFTLALLHHSSLYFNLPFPVQCPAGSFRMEHMIVCQPCRGSQFIASQPGAIECEKCPSGFKSNDGKTHCVEVFEFNIQMVKWVLSNIRSLKFSFQINLQFLNLIFENKHHECYSCHWFWPVRPLIDINWTFLKAFSLDSKFNNVLLVSLLLVLTQHFSVIISKTHILDTRNTRHKEKNDCEMFDFLLYQTILIKSSPQETVF